jgi:hypothetical protein
MAATSIFNRLQDIAAKSQLTLYPVMDGFYAVASDRAMMREFLSKVFLRLARYFVYTKENEHRFLTKCSVAFGDVIHGREIPDSASDVLKQHPSHKDSVLLGMPVVYASQTEPRAPPFGVFVHDSARDLLDPWETKLSHVWWRWFKSGDSVAKDLRKALNEYFDWCEKRAGAIDYDIARINAHRRQAEEYLVDA